MKRAWMFGWSLLALVFLAFLVRTFFLGIYYIDSPSMEPTLHGAERGGDWVLLAYGGAKDLRRYDLVALLPEGESEAFVKRVVGLPGESVVLRGGDLWIDGHMARPEPPVPALVPIFDDDLHDLEIAFSMQPLWQRVAGGWQLAADGVPAGSDAGLMFMRLGLEDHHLDSDGALVQGREAVADALLECSVMFEEPGIVLRLGLVEQGDRFEALLDTGASPRARLRLERRNASGSEVLAELEVDLPPGSHDLRFGNLDDRLSFTLDGALVLTATYEGNQLWPADTAKRGISQPTDRVFLGGVTGRAVFSGIRVFRDLHYTARGQYATDGPLLLGPDEIFVLGDNSRDSRDGRDWGETPLRTVIGRPVAVLWPLSRARSISRPQRP